MLSMQSNMLEMDITSYEGFLLSVFKLYGMARIFDPCIWNRICATLVRDEV
jgi:hypothetical protein